MTLYCTASTSLGMFKRHVIWVLPLASAVKGFLWLELLSFASMALPVMASKSSKIASPDNDSSVRLAILVLMEIASP